MGIELLSFLKRRKKVAHNTGGLKTVEPEKVPEYTPGLQEDGKTIIRLASNKKVKKPLAISKLTPNIIAKKVGKSVVIIENDEVAPSKKISYTFSPFLIP